MESHDPGIQMACVWPERVGVESPYIVHTDVAHSLSEQSNIVTTVYECGWVTIG